MRTFQLISVALLTFTSFYLSASSIFKTGDLERARIQAEMEGKMLIIDFYASWCAPCKWMEETTFADASVRQILSEKFVPFKVDIDDLDGYALKKEYGVRVLPTLLIFDKDGKVVQRVEETLPPSKMIAVLENSLKSFTPKVHATNVSPTKTVSKRKKVKQQEKFELKSRKGSYKLQLATFSSYSETRKYQKQMKRHLDGLVIILHDYQDGQVVYRVLTGNFDSSDDAMRYQNILRNRHGIASNICR